MTLAGPFAFRALQATLDGDADGKAMRFEEPAFERLREAIVDLNASELDRAILVRQALMFETARRGGGMRAEFRLGSDWNIDWATMGVQESITAPDKNLVALPWTPSWLSGPSFGDVGIDSWASAERTVRFEAGGVPGDPFLSRLNLDSYRSRGQRAAARAVLTTPPGATLTVVLATGEGKSLLFQLIDSLGFAGDDPNGLPGVTLVVVPTIALAIDQGLAQAGSKPRAWQAGSTANNAAILHAIRDGSQGLCFASPEAVCGPMRRALFEAAKIGNLRAIVIDEAHIVDAWGTGFRTEFQALSGVHFELLEAAPDGREPRTICLTATLTEAARQTLQTLFGAENFRMISAARLRPEPEFWFANATDEIERDRRVFEALLHLPRPAILYVTTVQAAKDWGHKLAHAGFRRLRVVHGETAMGEREATLNAWRASAVDLVVGTSAFGLGINYAHVRSVIHACVPETLDRYYQEVGRGGRDGRSSLSLVLPSWGDFATANSINETVTIGVPRGLERWLSMFDAPKRHLGGDSFALRLDVAPSARPTDIEMLGERSTDWNARVLTLMARAGILRLNGRPEGEFGEGEWLAVEILDHDHRSIETWQKRVAPLRASIASANSHSLELMRALLGDPSRCPADIFCEVYEDAIPVCSRCERCRNSISKYSALRPEHELPSPWPARALHDPIRSMLGQGRLLVNVDKAGPLAQRQLREMLIRLAHLGMRNILLFGSQRRDVEEAITGLSGTIAFVARELLPGVSALPPGPELLVVGDDAPLRQAHLEPRPPGRERVLLIRPECRSPRRPELSLSAAYNDRQMTLSEFYRGIL